LKSPPPLDRDLTLTTQDAAATLMEGDFIVVTAATEPVDVEVPRPPSFQAARDAEPHFTGLARHSFPGCFVCGPERDVGDGMRIFPGRIGTTDGQVAATWQPDSSLVDEDGVVRPEFLWAALDCPGYFAVEHQAGLALLGRMSATIYRPIHAGEQVIVTGWPIGSEGRKHHVGSALHDQQGELIAAAKATWITVKGERAA
jgi:acyl-coenzyme A thioesterase PaaI-like protein